MNQRIRELMVESGMYECDDFEPHPSFEKFAELLVRECASLAYDGPGGILEHFGVDEMNKASAYNTALALESASDSRYDPATGQYTFTADELEHYARIVAYKVAHNLENGFAMDPAMDPLNYVD